MSASYLENMASVGIINSVGATGSIALLVADDDLIVTSANMKVGAYTIAAQPKSACRISVFSTAVGATDTLGTVVIVGTDIKGDALSETVTPIAGTTVYTTRLFATITSVTGVGWVIGEGNDNIKVGVDYANAPIGYYIFAVQVLSDSVASSKTDITNAVNVNLVGLGTISAGSIVYGKWNSVRLTSGTAIGYLSKVV
jgi:hypothetical protein